MVLLQQQEGGIVGEAFGNPLIAIALPEHEIAPPLVRGFVNQDEIVEFARQGVEMKFGLLLRTEKRETREEHQAGPSLTQIARHLGQRQGAIGIGAKPLREALDCPGCLVGHGLSIAGGRRRRRSDGDRTDRSPAGNGRRADFLRGRFGKRFFDSFGSVGLHWDVARHGFGAHVLAEVEAGHGDGPLRDPARNFVGGGLRSRRRILFRFLDDRGRHLFSRRQQGPVRGIVKFHVELGGAQTEVRIPGAALADVEQSITRLRQNLAGVGEAQLQGQSGRERSRENDRDQVVAFSLQMRSFHGRVLDKVYGPAVGLHGIDLEIARQLEQQRPCSSGANSYLHFGRSSQSGWRLHPRLNPEGGDGDIVGQ